MTTTPSPRLVSDLWTTEVSPETYGSKEQYYQHVFEQYKIFIEMADRVSARRNLANTFFLTLHTLLISVATFAYEKGLVASKQWLIIFPLFAVLALCFVWWRLVHSYRQLNTAKYQVIGEYEKALPSSPYFRAEWSTLGRGTNKRLYWPLTDAENIVPVIFAILYVFAAGVITFL